MVLYEKNDDNSINVYTFEQNSELTVKYKQEQLNNIPDDEKFFVAKEFQQDINYLSWFERNKDKLEQTIFNINDLNIADNSGIRSFKTNQDLPEFKRIELMNKYIMGMETINSLPIRINFNGVVKYFLLSIEKFINDKNNSNIRICNEIIQLSESLYLLELILRNRFSLIKDRDIQEQLNIINFKYRGTYTKKDFIYGLIPPENKIEKSNSGVRIMKLLKK